nr:uncharacterized protein LOC109154451 [Ipomoea batatas]
MFGWVVAAHSAQRAWKQWNIFFCVCPVVKQVWGVFDALNNGSLAEIFNHELQSPANLAIVQMITRMWTVWTTRNEVVWKGIMSSATSMQRQLLQIAVASRRSPSQEWRSPETVIAVTVAAASEHHTSLRNLEIQVAQNSKALTERPQGSLPSTTVNNPRERAQAVTLRSGKELPEPILKKSTNPKSPIEEEIVEEILEDDKG